VTGEEAYWAGLGPEDSDELLTPDAPGNEERKMTEADKLFVDQSRIDEAIQIYIDKQRSEIASLRERLERLAGVVRHLITDNELAVLIQHPDAVARLKTYDEHTERLERAEAGIRRLQALITNSWRVVHLPSHKDGPWHVWDGEGVFGKRYGVGETPEAAIDAAMSSSKESAR
jgi:hypothetical protein